MQGKPIITVIVPMYNVASYLENCIESLLNQTFSDFELLLIDDGSTDNSLEIARKYEQSDGRVRVLALTNHGVSAARNQGLKVAQGIYIVFVDSDDRVMPNYLLRLHEAGQKYITKTGLIIQGFVRVSPEGCEINRYSPQKRILKKNEIGDVLREKLYGYPISKLYKKDVILKNNICFDENVYCCEDLLFMLEYLLFCDYVYYEDIQEYMYVQYPKSLSYKVNSFESEYKAFVKLGNILEQYLLRFDMSYKSIAPALETLMMIFQRVLKTSFLPLQIIPRRIRIRQLKMLIQENRSYIIDYYHPEYLLDKIGKKILVNKLVCLYDLFFTFLFKTRLRRYIYLGTYKA